MRVIVTGSRDFADAALIERVLGELLAEHRLLLLVHGACPTGADAIADAWARRTQVAGGNVLIDRFPANWGNYGRAAGMRRNAEMVASGAHLCLAFYQPGAANKGTSGCVKLARRAGIKVQPYGLEEDAVAPADPLPM